jgi:hypothetical protein
MLGVVLCKYCNCTIDTIDTEKVTTYYSVCDQEDCIERRNKQGDINNQL